MRGSLIVPEIDDPEQQRVARALRHEGLPYHVGLEVGTTETVKHYVREGLGIAVVSGICLGEPDRRDLDVIRIPSGYDGATTYGVVLRRAKKLTAPLRGLLPLLGAGEPRGSDGPGVPPIGSPAVVGPRHATRR